MPGKLARLIAITAIVGGLAGCQATNTVSQDTQGHFGQTEYTNSPTAHFYSQGHRETVGDVQGESLDGEPISLADYRGKVVMVNFWSSNCAPCEQEAPWLQTLFEQERSKGVQLVGIDERDNRAAALTFQRAHGITYPSIFDQTDAFILDFPGAVPQTTPFTIVLDRQGGIAAKATDAVDYTHLKNMLEFALQDKTT
jgi:peroxiredoxin